MEWKVKKYEEIGRELSKRGMEMVGMGRDVWVDVFVRDRENVNYVYVFGKYDLILNW